MNDIILGREVDQHIDYLLIKMVHIRSQQKRKEICSKARQSRKRERSNGSSLFRFLVIVSAVQAFAPPTLPTTTKIKGNDQYRLHAETPLNSDRQGLLQILNGEVGDVILERLNEKLNGGNSSIEKKDKKKRYQAPTDGLSKFHRSILATTTKRQRCVTGEYPLKITVNDCPTRKWLSSGSSGSAATSQMLVNGTSVERSLASYDRFQWLDHEETMRLHEGQSLFSLELLAEINVKKPGYVNVMPSSDAGFAAKKESEDATLWKNRYRLNYSQEDGNNVHVNGDEITDLGSFSNTRDLLERMLESDKERMWITGFSLTKQSGEVHYVDVENGRMGQISKESASAIRWPNEVNSVPIQKYGHQQTSIEDETNIVDEDALLVSDGFLVPGRDQGGVYVVSKPGHQRNEWRVCLAGGNGVDGQLSKLETKKKGAESDVSTDEDGWFYHRSIWIDLTGDGRQSVLTARAKRPSLLKKSDGTTSTSKEDVNIPSMPTKAQLVWLERPKPHSYDEKTGTPLDRDGLVFDPFSPKHTPWKVRVLDEGPDVMFSVADMDKADDTIEVFSAQFFNKILTMHSIQIGENPKVVLKRTIDDRCGASFSSILANLDDENHSPTREVIDSGSTVPTLKRGDGFSHLLITSHECSFVSDEEKAVKQKKEEEEGDYASEVRMGNEDPKDSGKTNFEIDGGSLFSYRVPVGEDAWKTEPWIRSVIATGFRVQGQLGNMINPGAPGFCYTFYPTKDGPKTLKNGKKSRPLIGIAGDCAESAYILRPVETTKGEDPSANYALMCEIECGATVGSIGIGYEDFCYAPQQANYAKIYLPCYENDKVLVFALGNGEDEEDNDGW